MKLCGFGIEMETFEAENDHGIGCHGQLLLNGKPVAQFDEEDPRAQADIQILDGWNGWELKVALDDINRGYPIPYYQSGDLKAGVETMFRFIEELNWLERVIRSQKGIRKRKQLLGVVLFGDMWSLSSYAIQTHFGPEVVPFSIPQTEDIEEVYGALLQVAKRTSARELLGPVQALLVVDPRKGAPADFTADAFAGMYRRALEPRRPGRPEGAIRIGGYGLTKNREEADCYTLTYQGKAVAGYRYGYKSVDWSDSEWDSDTLHRVCEEIDSIRPIRGYARGDLASGVQVMVDMIEKLEGLRRMYHQAEDLRTDEDYICAFFCNDGLPFAVPVEGCNPLAAGTRFESLLGQDRWKKRVCCAAVCIIPLAQGFPSELSGRKYAGMFLDMAKRKPEGGSRA